MGARLLRHAPLWLLFSGFGLWCVWRFSGTSAVPSEWALGGAFAVAISPLAVLVPRRARRGRFRRSALLVPVVVLASVIAAGVLRFPFFDPAFDHFVLRLIEEQIEDLSLPTLIALTTSVAVATDALGRARLESSERARRVLVAVSSLCVLGTIVAATPQGYMACFSPIDPAYGAACRAGDLVEGRLPLDLTAAAIALVAWKTCRSLRPLYTVAALWLVARSVHGGIELGVVSAVCRAEGTDSVPLGAHALIAGLFDVLFLTAWAGQTAWVTARLVLRAPGWARLRRSVRTTWPLVPLALVLLSPRFDAPVENGFPQQRPRAVWEELGIEPLRVSGLDSPVPFFITNSAHYESYLLDARGELHGVAGTRHAIIHEGEVSSLEPFYGTNMLVDRRARLGDVLDVLPRLRDAHHVSIAFLTNEDPVDPRLLERWPAVAMAARTIRSVHLEFLDAPLERCARLRVSGIDLRRCRHPHHEQLARVYDGRPPAAYIVDGPRDAPIAALVRAASMTHGDFYLTAPEPRGGERLVDLHGGADVPLVPLMLPRVGLLAVFAAIALFIAIVALSVVRDLRILRRRRATWQRGDAERARDRFPRWLAPSDVDDWREPSGIPFRQGPTLGTASSSRAALIALSRRLGRTAIRALGHALLWVALLALPIAIVALIAALS